MHKPVRRQRSPQQGWGGVAARPRAPALARRERRRAARLAPAATSYTANVIRVIMRRNMTSYRTFRMRVLVTKWIYVIWLNAYRRFALLIKFYVYNDDHHSTKRGRYSSSYISTWRRLRARARAAARARACARAATAACAAATRAAPRRPACASARAGTTDCTGKLSV